MQHTFGMHDIGCRNHELKFASI